MEESVFSYTAKDSYRRVDFNYAFAVPHRVTTALPDSSNKTLIDARAGSAELSWTSEDLRNIPVATFQTPRTEWHVTLTPAIDGHPFPASKWVRPEGWLPALLNTYQDHRGAFTLDIRGCSTAAIARIEVTNYGEQEHVYTLNCALPGGLGSGYNPAWIDSEEPADAILGGWHGRADRILLVGQGAQRYPTVADSTLSFEWRLGPGEKATGWLIRPYEAYAADLHAIRATNWQVEFEGFVQTWQSLRSQVCSIAIPDPDVMNALHACFADLFIMREPVEGGLIGSTPGTETYRAVNPVETAIISVALDQLGLHEEALRGYQVSFDQQGEDGDWADPKGWAHTFWSAAGFKAWAAIEHFRLSRNTAFLEKIFPRMMASARHHERLRTRTRVLKDGERSTEYGLLPRGQGDAGLMNGDDYHGVFLPHNIWAVYSDGIAAEAAGILGRKSDQDEATRIYENAKSDLLAALDKGAIQEDGYRWIPGVANKTSGSRWGALNAAFPCNILEPDHELITGTLRHIESKMGPGGIPLAMGWQQEGLWVAIALDNLAETHLMRGNGDAASEYLYATLNHATPLLTWCEERGQEAGTQTKGGDPQHLWTPVSVVRIIRDLLIMEDHAGLQLALGTPRQWLTSGAPIGVANAPTHFGKVSYQIAYDAASSIVRGHMTIPSHANLTRIRLSVRLGQRLKTLSLASNRTASLNDDGGSIEWKDVSGDVSFEAIIG